MQWHHNKYTVMTETYLHIKPLLINRYLKYFHAMFDLSNDLLEKMNWSKMCHDRIRPVSSQLQHFIVMWQCCDAGNFFEPLIINFFQELPTLTINVHIVHTWGHIRAAFSPCLAMVIRHVPCHCHSVATRHTISIIQSHGYIIYTRTSASHASHAASILSH